jgi:aminocarboxymuconate-semialdehyde decarboxylase
MTIDVHGHVTSPELFRRFPMPPSLADIDGMIERKAGMGIEMTIVGSPVGAGTMVPMPGLDNFSQPADQIDAFHEWVAETVRRHPDHLRGYLYVNPNACDGSLDRVAERLGQDEFVGLIVNTSVRGEYLDSPGADQVFALAAETAAPVLLHPPAEPVGTAAMRGHVGLLEHVARPCDITSGLAAILFAGWLQKYPQLRLIVANAGGALPLLREKLDLAQQRAPERSPTEPASALLRRCYADTATPSKPALAAAAEVFGPEHLLFGTDSPPLSTPLDTALELVAALPVTERQREGILHGNARAVFGLDRGTTEGQAPR